MAQSVPAATRLRWQSRELSALRPALHQGYAQLSDHALWQTLDAALRDTMSQEQIESFWNQVGNVLSGALSGAAPGAAMGAVGGPYGALIGAGLGAVSGGVRAAMNQPPTPGRGAVARPPVRPAAPPRPAPPPPSVSAGAEPPAPTAPAAVAPAEPPPATSTAATSATAAAPTSAPATSNLLDPQLIAGVAQALLPVLLQQLGRRDGVALGRRGLRVHPLAALDALRLLVDRARDEAESVLGRDPGHDAYLRGPLGDFVGEPSQPEVRAARVLELLDEERALRSMAQAPADIITPLPGSRANLARFRRGVSNTRDFPYSAICQLRMQMSEAGDAWFIGTGFYVGENLILTAGHNVHHARYGRATRMIVTPGRQSLLVRPYASFELTPGQMHAHPRWSRAPVRADFDMAVLTVNTPAPHSQYFELVEERLASMQALTVCGYAASEEDGVDPNEQNLDQDTVRVRSAETITYSLNTTGGTSGSPAYAEFDGRLCAVGVHSRTNDRYTNMGCRLTSDKLQWVRSLSRSVPDYAEPRATFDPQDLHILDAEARRKDEEPIAFDRNDPLSTLFELQQGRGAKDAWDWFTGGEA